MSQAVVAIKLVKCVKEYVLLKNADDPSLVQRRNDLYEKILLIGETAAFFGDYEAMKSLHDAAERLVGNNNSIGYHLNHIWHGVGTWIG